MIEDASDLKVIHDRVAEPVEDYEVYSRKRKAHQVYSLTLKKAVKKELDVISNPDFLKIDEAILSRKKQPFPHPQSKS